MVRLFRTLYRILGFTLALLAFVLAIVIGHESRNARHGRHHHGD